MAHKTHKIQVVLSQEQREAIQRKADAVGLGLSTYMRKVALEAPGQTEPPGVSWRLLGGEDT